MARPQYLGWEFLIYEYWNEALHGVARGGEATVFPQTIAMAATWDPGIVHLEGQTIGIEGGARYNKARIEGNPDRYYGLTFWAPNINIFRDPRWGRGQETLGKILTLPELLPPNSSVEFMRNRARRNVHVRVKNIGNWAGDEVVQLYLSDPARSVFPNYALRGFQRVHLSKGEQKEVGFTLCDRELRSRAMMESPEQTLAVISYGLVEGSQVSGTQALLESSL